MKLKDEQIEFIKTHRAMLESIISERMTDYFNLVVDEPDLQRKEILSLLVKEFRSALITIENFSNQKEKVERGEEYTGL